MSPRTLRQWLLIIVCALLGYGTVAVYSASAVAALHTYGQSAYFVRHHVVAIAVGLALGLGCLLIPYRALRASSRWLLVASLVLLALVFLIGHEVGGARRWFHLGRWSLQPSELAQIALVLYLSDLLARKGSAIRSFSRGVLPAVIVTAIAGGLVLLQPDLGTAIVMGAVALLLLVVARARWQHVAGVMAVAAVVILVLLLGAAYRRERLLAFFHPWGDPQGSGYQILQSYFAFSNGGLIGRGVGGSLQKLFYLPSAHTDFIFAIIAEELGLLGATALIGLFALLLTCGFRMATVTQDVFSKYLVCGLVGLVGMEAIVNMAVVTGLLPTKGLPLPLVSYGGTAMTMNLIACALIMWASRHGERTVPHGAVRH